MIHETIDIDYKGKTATLTTYVRDLRHTEDDITWPFVLVVPGGAYGGIAEKEAEPIALRFNNYEFHSAVLRYSFKPETFPTSLCQLAKAVSYIKDHAAEWRVDTNKIYVAGFSAGGHLVASLGVFYNRQFLSEYTGLSAEQMRPSGLILSYPVISSGEYGHQMSIKNLLGEKYYDKDCLEMVSLEKQVTKDTPRTFIWSTNEDDVVPCENSMLFAKALRENGVEFELHVYPKGLHGLVLATKSTISFGNYEDYRNLQNWTDLAAMFINK